MEKDHHGLTVVTRDRIHFDRAGVPVVNPWDSAAMTEVRPPKTLRSVVNRGSCSCLYRQLRAGAFVRRLEKIALGAKVFLAQFISSVDL
jgi:hypothetical protein